MRRHEFHFLAKSPILHVTMNKLPYLSGRNMEEEQKILFLNGSGKLVYVSFISVMTAVNI